MSTFSNQIFASPGIPYSILTNNINSVGQVVASRIAPLSIPNLTSTVCQFDSVGSDPFITYNAGTFTVLKQGQYRIEATIVYDLNVTGVREVYIVANDDVDNWLSWNVAQNLGLLSQVSASTSRTLNLNANDTFRVFTRHSAGGSLNILGSGAGLLFYTQLVVTRNT